MEGAPDWVAKELRGGEGAGRRHGQGGGGGSKGSRPTGASRGKIKNRTVPPAGASPYPILNTRACSLPRASRSPAPAIFGSVVDVYKEIFSKVCDVYIYIKMLIHK